jgi:hypothetical protein
LELVGAIAAHRVVVIVKANVNLKEHVFHANNLEHIGSVLAVCVFTQCFGDSVGNLSIGVHLGIGRSDTEVGEFLEQIVLL